MAQLIVPFWRRTLRRLTKPSDSIIDPGDRRQARLLATLLLVMISFSVVLMVGSLLDFSSEFNQPDEDIIWTVVVVVVLSGCYGLSRMRYHRWAAWLAVLTLSLGTFSIIIPVTNPRDGNLFIYLLVPVLVSSALLSPRSTLILAAGQVAGMLVSQIAYEELTFSNSWVGFVSFTSIIIVLLHRHLKLVERERQQDLTETAATLNRTSGLAEALADTATALSRTLDLDDVLDRILARLSDVVPHDAADVMLIEGNHARIVRCRGYAERDLAEVAMTVTFSISDAFPIRDVFVTGQPRLIPDVLQQEGWVSLPASAWIRSHIVAPIQVDGQVIGLLNADSATPDFFLPDHLTRLQLFANQAAIAIENARLYEHTRRYADEVDALYRATSFLFTSLSTNTDMEAVAKQIVQAVIAVFEQVSCGLTLRDPGSNMLAKVAHASKYEFATYKPLQLDGPGLIPAAIRAGQMVYAPDVHVDPRYMEGDPRVRSELVLPLNTSEGTIGALDVQSTAPDAFSAQDQRVLVAFAERASAVIENCRLYARIQHHSDDLERRVRERTADLSVRNDVAQTLSSLLDIDEMLNGVLSTTVQRLAVTGGGIYLLDETMSSLDLRAFYGLPPETLNLVTGITPGDSDLGILDTSPPNISQKTGIRAVLNVPIWRQEQVQGIITLAHDQRRPWTTDETHMIDAIGRQIGVALANARLYAGAVEGEARIRTILESVADGLLVFDREANLVLINPAATRLFDFYADESGGAQRAAAFLGQWLRAYRAGSAGSDTVEFDLPVQSLVGDDESSIMAQCRAENCPLAQRQDMVWPCWLGWGNPPIGEGLHKSCAVYPRIARRAMRAHSATVPHAADEVSGIGTVIVLHDVTHFRELEELKEGFVSNVSHELVQPLSAMILRASSLHKYFHRLDSGKQYELVTNVLQQSYALRDLVDDILALSRFDAHRMPVNTEWFDLAKQCRDVVHTLTPNIEAKQLSIDTARCLTREPFLGDPSLIKRAIGNLIGNAVKYTPEGGAITVSLASAGGTVRLAVRDTGIGIAPDKQRFIFDRFFRTDEASQMTSGTGLGLAITREIIELHGGQITLDSTPGEGSTFTVILPVGE